MHWKSFLIGAIVSPFIIGALLLAEFIRERLRDGWNQ